MSRWCEWDQKMTSKIIIFIISYFEFCSALEDRNDRKYTQNNCKCDTTKCRSTINAIDCDLNKGKYIEKSFNDNKCNCCSTCIVRKSLGKSCFPSKIEGLKIKCEHNLYCDNKFGYICLEFPRLSDFDRNPKIRKHKKYRQLKHKYLKPYTKETKLSKVKNNKSPKSSDNKEFLEFQKPLKRKIRSPLKIGLLGSPPKKKKKTKPKALPEEEAETEETEIAGNVGKIENKKYSSKEVKLMANSNTINQNSGSTFIINKNYYAYIGGKLTKLKEPPIGSHPIGVKMDKDPTAATESSEPESRSSVPKSNKKLKKMSFTVVSDQKSSKEGKKSKRTLQSNGKIEQVCDLEPHVDQVKYLEENYSSPKKMIKL